MKKVLVLLLITFLSCSSQAQMVYIIVPGTWSGEHGWHSTGGNFFENLKQSVDSSSTSIITYYWSGKNNHKSREYAAQGLANLILGFPPEYIINLVTHSHGSNVGILASQLLEKNSNNKHIINAFYAFATPIEPDSYFPAMQVIKQFFNFFSYSDFVQTVLGTFNRVYPPHEHIANISVTIHSLQPNHDTIHDPIIAQWLPKIPACFPDFDSTKPINIAFFADKKPEYSIEHNRKELLEEDFYLTQHYIFACQRKDNHEQ